MRRLAFLIGLCGVLSTAACGDPRPQPPAVSAPRSDVAPRPVARRPPPRPVYRRSVKALVGGTLIQTRRGGVQRNVTVLIRGDRIAAVGPVGQVKVPADADVIDVRGRYLVPGLIDGHIHFFQDGGLYTRPDGLDLRHRVPYEKHQRQVRAAVDDTFRRYLRSGITTVVDLGGPQWNFDVRAQARRTRAAPRVFVAGPLIASYQPPALKSADPPILRVNTPEEAVAMVRQQAAKKADLIKVWYVVSKKLVEKGLALDVDRFYPILEAVVAESRKHRLPVFVHATQLDTAKRALRAGADVLVHSVRDKDVDREFLRLAKARRAVYIPTLWVFHSYEAVYSKQLQLLPVEHWRGNPRIISTLFDMYELAERELGARQKKLLAHPKPIRPHAVLLRNLKAVQDAGLVVAAGTDAGNVGVVHGPALFHDFQLMKQAGMTNRQILVSATYHGAVALGRQRDLGSLEPGKLADLLVLGADPLADIMHTTDARLIVKGGHVFRPDELVPTTPEDLAQIQLNAYNAQDLETFLSVYGPDVQVFRFPSGKKTLQGRAAMRRTYRKFFARAKPLHCKLLNRIVSGRFVMDLEHVTTGLPKRKVIHGTAIYETRDGLIRKVWFVD